MRKKAMSLVLTLAILFYTPLMALGQEKTSFTIDECVDMALENNTMLQIKAWDLEKSKVEREEAIHLEKIDRARDDLKEIRLPVPTNPTEIIQGMVAGMKIAQTESVVYGFEGAQGKDVAPRLKEAEELIAKRL